MSTAKPCLFIYCLRCAGCLSWLPAAVHYYLLGTQMMEMPPAVAFSQEGMFRNLRRIWHIRLVKGMLRIAMQGPFGITTLGLVNSTLPLSADSGYVIAICHTPWKRLLVQWCLENDFAMVVGNGTWRHRKRRIQKQARGFRDLRAIIRHLQNKGRLVVAFDQFSNSGCRLKFMGKEQNFSNVSARLARVAGVPLVAAIPRLRHGVVDIECSAEFVVSSLKFAPERVMQTLVTLLEQELRDDPALWPPKYYQAVQTVADLG